MVLLAGSIRSFSNRKMSPQWHKKTGVGPSTGERRFLLQAAAGIVYGRGE
jgi:hypothetical protein